MPVHLDTIQVKLEGQGHSSMQQEENGLVGWLTAAENQNELETVIK